MQENLENLSFLLHAHPTQPISPYFCFTQSYLSILRAALNQLKVMKYRTVLWKKIVSDP